MKKQKHKVRFSFDIRGENKDLIDRYSDIKVLEKSKPIICGVQRNSESYKILIENDLIISINNKKINNCYDLSKIIKKLKWGKKTAFKVKRNGKIIEKEITPISFDKWKNKISDLGISVVEKKDVLTNKLNVEVKQVHKVSSARPGMTFIFKDSSKIKLIEEGDTIISLNSKKINSLKDWDLYSSKLIPGEIANIKIKDTGNFASLIKMKITSFGNFLKVNEKGCRKYWPKRAADILLKEYEENDYYVDDKWEKRKSKIIQKYSDEEYQKKVIEPFAVKYYKQQKK